MAGYGNFQEVSVRTGNPMPRLYFESSKKNWVLM